MTIFSVVAFFIIIADHFKEATLLSMLSYCIYTGINFGWLDPSYMVQADEMQHAVYSNGDDLGLIKNASAAA
jgi:hypothetical protein